MTRIQSGQPVRPYVDFRIDAGNDLKLDVTSLDFDSAKEAPSSMRYRIDNLTDFLAITAWTSVGSPAEVSTISITAATNAMSTDTRDRQLNQITVEATYADGSKAKATAVYELCRVYEV